MKSLLCWIRCVSVWSGILLAVAWFPPSAIAQTEDGAKKSDAAEPTDPEAEKLAKKLRTDLLVDKKRNPKLHGFLIAADPDAQTELQVIVTVIVDKDEEEVALDAVREVIEKEVEKTAYKLDVKPHPVAKLLAELRQGMLDDVELKDCRLDDVEYADEAEVTKVVLRGLILQAGQRAKMTDLGNRTIVAVYGADDEARPVANAGELELLEAPDAESIEIAKKFNLQLLEAVKKDPKVRTYYGALVAAYRDPKSKAVRFTITLIVDKGQKPDVPQSEVEALAVKQLPQDSFDKIVVQLHPVADLVVQFQKAVANQKALQVSCVEDLYYEFQEGGWVLQLVGAFTKQGQKEELIKLANEVLAVLYAVQTLPLAKADEFVLFERDAESLLAEQDLKQQLLKAALADAKLFGASLVASLDPCAKKTRFRMEVVIDQSQVDAELTELESLATRTLPPGSLDKSTVLKHPATKVLKKLREVIATSPELTGCQIDDVAYVVEDDALSFEMIGTHARHTQRVAITQRCNQVLEEVYAGTDLPIPVARASQLALPTLTAEAFVAKLRKRIEANKTLIGCQITSAAFVDQDGNRGLELFGHVAHSRQRAAVIAEANAILADIYGDNPPFQPLGNQLRVVYMPTAELLAELQRQLEFRLRLDGCQITSAAYTLEVDSEFLELSGRMAMAEQRELLTDAANAVLDKMYGPEWPRVKIQMKLVPPSELAGSRFFSLGTGHYVQRDFATAERDFRQAVLEAPLRLEYKYWHIATLIAQGRDEQAYARLRQLTYPRRRNMHDDDYIKVLYSLENVQGPIRMKLVRLEHRAFIEGLPK